MIGPNPEGMGGMSTVESNIIKGFRSRGGSSVFITTFEDGCKVKKLIVAARAYLPYLFELEKCDLVHVHMASRGSYKRKKVFMDAAFRCHKPVLLHLHGSEFALWFDSECTDIQKDDIRRTFKRCAKVVVLSKEWKDFLISRSICDADQIVVLHNAVEVPDDNQTDYLNNTVLFMGRLDLRKSPDVLLRAGKIVLRKHPDARFVFGGDGDVQRYKDLAVQLGIEDACSFIGWAKGNKKAEAFRSSSIYCLPSKNEGMPMSVLEAMSYGLATVSTPVGGVPQIITDGVNGLMFPVDKVNLLAGLLCKLMDDVVLKERIGRAGRETIKTTFSFNAFMEQLITIYEEICK